MSAITLASRMASRLLRWSACAFALSGAIFYSLSAAEPPRLTANVVSGGSDLRLELHGATGTNYTIESSTNLNVWTRVADGLPQNGILSTALPLSTAAKQFFRGRETGGATVAFPTNVIVAANTNFSVTTIITTNGGSAVLYATNGTQITFTVPPLTLPEPQVITLTLVTNLGGLPFAGGLIGSVRLEPDGLELWGAATLQISIPTNVDRRKIVSFSANNDGSEFHLELDRVTTNGIVIPVTQLALYGSAVAERSELSGASIASVATLAALNTEDTSDSDTDGNIDSDTTASDTDTSAEGQLRAATANLNDCFPDRAEIARLIARNLLRNMRSMSQDLASLLVEARQNQIFGVTEDTFDTGDVLNAGEDATCQYMRTQIQPYYADAIHNCELMRVLLMRILAIERQRQVIGAEANPSCASSFRDFPLCAGLQNCLKEIEICCLGGRKGPSKIAAIHALSRQDQLLGTACLSQSSIDQAVEACSSNAWTGTIVFNANAEETENFSDGRVTQVTTDRYIGQFTGQVWESQELIFPGIGGTVTLHVRGTITYDEYYNQTTDVTGDCGGSHTIDESRTVAAGESWYRVDLNVREDGTYSLIAGHGDSKTGMPGAFSSSTDSYYHRFGRKVFTEEGSDCVSKVESNIQNTKGIALFPPLAFFTGRTDGTNFTGNATIEKFLNDPATDGRYQWDFQRRRTE